MFKKIFLRYITAVIAAAVTLGTYPVLSAADTPKQTTLVTYSVPNEVERNGAYTVKVRPEGAGNDEWQEIPVIKAKVMSNGVRDSAMVYFDCDGRIEVQVTCNGNNIDEIENGLNSETAVYPESYGIDLDYTIGGNIITLTVMPKQTVVLDPNGDTRRNLQIWAGEILELPTEEEISAQGKTVTVVDASKGDTLASSYDTDVVYVKPGYYDNKGVSVRSNQTWYMAGGAVVHETISLDYTTNAKLIGRGIVYRPQYAAITINDAVNAYVEGMMSLNYGWANGGGYGINIANGKNVFVKNVKSIGNGKWGDCMDIFCSEDITVENCFFRGNDDCIAIYGPRWTGNYWGDTGNVRNIKVKGCVLMPDLARPIHFGTHGDSSSPNGGRVIDNCRFEDIDILTYNKEAYRLEWNASKQENEFKRMPQPIRMDVSEGNTVTNIYFNNIRIRDYMANELVELFITTQDRYGTYTYPGKGINNIYFKDIDYRNTDDTFTGRIEGYKNSNGIDGITQNVTFENLLINGKVAHSAKDAHLNIGSNTKNIKFVNSGEAKYVYNPSIVPEDIWPEFYDYAQNAIAEASENESKPEYAIDNDTNTVWYSPVSERQFDWYDKEGYLNGIKEINGTEQTPVPEKANHVEGDGITVDLGAQRHIKGVRITWANPQAMHDYRILVSKDGTDWSAGHSDEHGEIIINSRTRPDLNKKVKTNWLANQHDPNQGQDNIIGRYVKIIPCAGYSLDIAEIEILGNEMP